MSEKKSALLKKLTKQLAVGLPVIALSGFLPGTAGVLVSSASAEHHGHAESHYKKAKSEAEAKSESEAKAEAEAKPESEAKAEAEAESEYKY